MVLLNLFKLLRPKHWIKNLLVFAAALFSFSLDVSSVAEAALAFVALSFIASTVYIFNDIVDKEKDKSHPKKKFRPIASGKVKVWQAVAAALILLAVGILISLKFPPAFQLAILTYLIINLLYSLGFKNLAIIDVMIVATGFVLRVIAGAYAINVPVSHWILLCTFFISLFLAFGKRKNEMDVLDADSRSHRHSISEYTDGFIAQMLSITAGISIVFYALYTIDPETTTRFGSHHLIYTTPIVVFAVLRYFHLLYNKKDGGDPVAIFTKDLQIILAVFAWLASVTFVYLVR